MRDTIERRLSVLEEKKGNAAWHNPRTPEQNELADRYWDSLIHMGKVSKKLEKAYLKMPRLRCSEGTNQVVYERIAAGILGRQKGEPEKDVRDAVMHDRDQPKKTPVKTELRPLEKSNFPPSVEYPLSYRCLHSCSWGGMKWREGQIYDNLARSKGIPEPDGPCWEPFNPNYEEVPARTIRVRTLT